MFYVYVHRRATDGKIFYVGKGKGRRSHSFQRNIYWKRIVAKHGYTVEIVQDHLQEWYAFELEKDLIAYYGRENLCNLTDGGEGASGRPMTEKHKKKLSQVHKGNKHTLGFKFSEEMKKRMSDSKKGIPKPIGFMDYARSFQLRPVVCSNGMAFESISAAIQWLWNEKGKKAYTAGICCVCKGQKKSAFGYGWAYKDSGIEPIAKRKIECSNGMIFYSTMDAERWLRTNGWPKAANTNISLCSRGKTKQAYGYTWKYI